MGRSKPLCERVRVDPEKPRGLEDFDPRDSGDLDKAGAAQRLEEGVERLSELQERLYAQDRWAVLLLFQGMDAAGKDGTVKHVLSGKAPQLIGTKGAPPRRLSLWMAAATSSLPVPVSPEM